MWHRLVALQEGGRAEESLPVRAQRSSARAGTAEAGGGIVQLESPRHTSAMQGILSEIRGLVERSDITKVSVLHVHG